jgi:hypothetical protein
MMRHLRKVFVDPVTGKAEWGLVLIGDRIVGVHSLSEQKPIKQANFEAEVIHFANAENYTQWVFTYPPNLLIVKENNQPAVGTITKLQDITSGNTDSWRQR